MSGQYDGKHEVSTVGPTISLAFTGATGRVKLEDNPSVNGPLMFLLLSDQDVYIRQGDETVTAASTGFLLKANVYYKILVTSTLNNHVAAVRVDTNGTLRCTLNSSDEPGDGSDS